MTPTNESEQAIILLHEFIDSETDSDRFSALTGLSKLSSEERDLIAAELVDRFNSETSESLRAWIISALAAIQKRPEMFLEHIDPTQEPSERIRYWTTVGLPLIFQGKELREALARAASDPNKKVRAAALRSLIEIGYENEYTESLIELLTSSNIGEQLAAIKALRIRSYSSTESNSRLYNQFGNILENLISNTSVDVNCRYQALFAFSELNEGTDNLINIFIKLLENEQDVSIKLGVLQITGIRRLPLPKDLLLEQIQANPTYEYWQQSVQTLTSVLGQLEAVDVVIEKILSQEKAKSVLLDALKLINYARAASQLSKYLQISDLTIAERAFQAFIS